MKKTLFVCLMVTFTIISFAQTESGHLTFKGVPIDGTLTEYVSKMKAAGFSLLETEDGTAILQGDFAGFKGCKIGVSTLKATDVVNTIGVIFPECEDWSSLENRYELIKLMLTQKYGQPAECLEKFQTYREPNDNGSKLTCLKMEQCIYYTIFETAKGKIRLSLEHVWGRGCFVMLQYWDKINTDTVRAQALEDL